MTRPRLLITRRPLQAVLDLAATRFDVKLWPHDRPIGDDLLPWAQNCDALLVMATDRIEARHLQQLRPRLQAVATYSVGYEHLDVEGATAQGLPVFHTPDVLSDAVAEIAMLLMLSAARDADAAAQVLRRGEWGPWSPTRFVGRQLTGRRLGLYGMGRIGLAVAQRALGFGLSIHYHNRQPHPDGSAYTYHDTLASLLSVSDVLCVCAPSTPQTRGAINRERLACLPRGAIVVNIARGDLIDEDALFEAMATGQVGAVGLDVFRNEPHLDPRFLALPRASLLPHVGSATEEARLEMGRLALQGLDDWLTHRRLAGNCLNPGVAGAQHRETGAS